MRLFLLAILSGLCTVAFAEPTTQPAADATTQPTTKPALAMKFPTPQELIEKWKQLKEEKQEQAQVAYISLADPIVEKPADFSLFGEIDVTTLRSVIDRLHQARDDEEIEAVLVTIGSPGVSLAQAQEIRDALVELKQTDKRTFVYADSYDTVSYTIASGATDVCLMEGGEILIPGVGGEAMFAKGLLDKIGVKADYIQIGEYKGADETFTRTGPSDELRAEMNKLMDALYDEIISGIATHRDLSEASIKQIIDETMISAARAKEHKLIDHIVELDGLRELLAEQLDEEIDLLHGYGEPEDAEIDLSSPFAFFALLAKRPETTDEPTIALIHAEGMIIDGEGGEGLFGNAVGSDDMRRAFRTARRDENVKAIVLRINSPGGSALASEAIWQAMRRTSDEKPVIVSVGTMAASGGYYLACAGDYIFADQAAIVGSIGVVGGKFVLKDLFDKIGLSSESFTRGANADLFSSNQPFTDSQREMITKWMKQTYEQFVNRILATRKDKIKDIDQVARGRIFLARQAKELGMVDEIGGVEAAIAYAAKQAELEPGNYEVQILPAPKTFADLLRGDVEETKSPIKPQVTIAPDSMLHVLSPLTRSLLGQQLQMIQLLQQRPVILTMPCAFTVR